MSKRSILKTNRSLRTLRRIKSDPKRFKFGKISSMQDLRSFFYEYSLFIGDIQSLPGMPNLSTLGTLRHYGLVGGRIMGDVNSIMGTFKKLTTGSYDVEGAGERIVRRAGGRLTGKVLQAVPGSNMFSRAARSVIGANTQKAFDKQMKKWFRSNVPDKPVVHVVGGFDAQAVADSVESAIAMVTEEVARQTYPFVPVRTGTLRGTLRTEFGRNKAKGGSMPAGKVIIGNHLTKDYTAIIEFGSGKLFNQGAKHLDRYFPVPESVKALKSSSKNRAAVNSKNGKGAMLRRGARNAMARYNQGTATNIKVTTPNLELEAKKLRS